MKPKYQLQVTAKENCGLYRQLLDPSIYQQILAIWSQVPNVNERERVIKLTIDTW